MRATAGDAPADGQALGREQAIISPDSARSGGASQRLPTKCELGGAKPSFGIFFERRRNSETLDAFDAYL